MFLSVRGYVMANHTFASTKGELLNKLYDDETLTSEELTELALSYVLPRTDNKTLARELLEKFGSFSNIIMSDWLILKESMTERSAKALSLLFNVFEHYVESGIDKRYKLNNSENVSDFFEELLRFKQIEETFIVGVDAKGNIKSKSKLSRGGIRSVGVSTHDVARFVAVTKPAKCFMCHNHPNGSALPSNADIKGNELMMSLCKKLKVDFLDHIIVGIDGVFSLLKNQFLRKFN